jgi:hypothetical protein
VNAKSTLGDDWPGIVMGHDMCWANHDIFSSLDNLAISKTDGVVLHNLFDESLRYALVAIGDTG